jgi:hypothetical protein
MTPVGTGNKQSSCWRRKLTGKYAVGTVNGATLSSMLAGTECPLWIADLKVHTCKLGKIEYSAVVENCHFIGNMQVRNTIIHTYLNKGVELTHGLWDLFCLKWALEHVPQVC